MSAMMSDGHPSVDPPMLACAYAHVQHWMVM